jgi:putative FmdB family regulatory protein
VSDDRLCKGFTGFETSLGLIRESGCFGLIRSKPHQGVPVPIYEYRCEIDGVFEVMRALGTAPDCVACPTCGSEATRGVFSAPSLRNVSRIGLYAAIDHAEKSRYEPEVVTSVPSAGARRRTPVLPLTPKLRRLPRP